MVKVVWDWEALDGGSLAAVGTLGAAGLAEHYL